MLRLKRATYISQTKVEKANSTLINVEPEKSVIEAIQNKIAYHLNIMAKSPGDFGIDIKDSNELVVGVPLAIFSISDDCLSIEISQYLVPVFERGRIAATFLLSVRRMEYTDCLLQMN